MELPGKIDAIIREISYRKGIQPEEVKRIIEFSLIQTAKRVFNDFNSKAYYIASITENSDIELFQVKEVVSDDTDSPFDHPEKYIYVDQAEELIKNDFQNYASYVNTDREKASILDFKYYLSFSVDTGEIEFFEVDKFSDFNPKNAHYLGDYISFFGENNIIREKSKRISKIAEFFENIPPHKIWKEKQLEIQDILTNENDRKNSFEIEVGDKIHVPIDLKEFGANGTAMFFSQIERNIEESIEEKLYNTYKEKLGKIIKGKVISVDINEDTTIEFEDIRAVLTRNNRIKGEKFEQGDIVRVVVKNVELKQLKRGKEIKIEVSRTSIKFLNALLEKNIPEVESGVISVHKIARIPGEKSKVSVSSINPKVDPVTTIIGKKGVRVNSISKEVNNEIIDCFHYSEDPVILIKNSLAPARVDSIKIKDRDAFVVISPEERGKAIGKKGINLKLASMVTGFEIKVLNSENLKSSQNGDDSNSNEFNNSNDNFHNALEALFK